MKSIALFFGSFNPIHLGHLVIANWICEYGEADEVWFIVSPQNPFKCKSGLADERVRLRWVEQSIAEYPRFRVSDIEFGMPLPSYTINTLERLKEQYPDTRFLVIIGTDNWLRFDGWKEYQRIINEFGLIVYPRHGYEIDRDQLPNTVRYIHAPLIEISSTFIRESLRQGKELPFFIEKTIYPEIKRFYSEEIGVIAPTEKYT